MAKRFTISDIPNLSGRTIFFDANILIYLFWSIGNEAQLYSSIFGKLYSNKNNMAINTFVLSEVINRVLRIEWKNEDEKNKKKIDFKSFRNSSKGQSVQKDIFDIIKNKILKYFQVIDKQLTITDIKNMLVIDRLDFNDKIIFDVCKAHNMILLTHDADFKDTDIDILSANQKFQTR